MSSKAGGWRGGYGRVARNAREHRILRWLQKKPHAASYLGETPDGDEIKTPAADKLVDTVGVLKPCEHIKALDKDGAVIRVLDLTDPEMLAELELDEEKRRGGSGGILSVDVPKLTNGLADAFCRVAESAASQNAKDFQTVVTALLGVVQVQQRLLTALEQRLGPLAGEPEPEPSQEDGVKQLLAHALSQGGNGANGSNGGVQLPPDLINLISMLQAQKAAQGPNGS